MSRLLILVLGAVFALAAVPGRCEGAADATLFRIYLTDGTSVVSYGEYARVGDQVVFSMLAGGSVDQPRLHVATLDASQVDWPQTERYAASARYQQYAASRGDEDFQLLSNEVARVLNDIALSTDRDRALATAEQARRTLSDWPKSHYGYRQDEVREIVGLIDESIARLRAPGRQTEFQLSLVSSVPEVWVEPLAIVPSPREQLDQIMKLSAVTGRAVDRVALLQSALALLNDAPAGLAAIDAAAFRRSIEGQLKQEATIDARYTDLSRRLLTSATRAAARARVADVERMLDQIQREDVRLGARRPEAVASLRAAVQAQLDSARHLRLLRDQWQIRRALYRDYQRTLQSEVLQLVKAQPALESIRRLTGPAPDRLVGLRGRLDGGADRLARSSMPDDLRTAHDLLISAWRFAEHAVDIRYAAVASGNVSTAWEASSAAAGALMLLSRAQQEIRALLDPPKIQ